jgi:hypothetical protein
MATKVRNCQYATTFFLLPQFQKLPHLFFHPLNLLFPVLAQDGLPFQIGHCTLPTGLAVLQITLKLLATTSQTRHLKIVAMFVINCSFNALYFPYR